VRVGVRGGVGRWGGGSTGSSPALLHSKCYRLCTLCDFGTPTIFNFLITGLPNL
jgi:hypothetical protein